jgi:transposase
MNEVREFIGIDISKLTFDVYSSEIGAKQFSNDESGFKELLALVDDENCCVMEATGAYHHRLAEFLFDKGIRVSVTSGLAIKRFGQMKFKRNKNDKADAELIWSFAQDQGVVLWEPNPAYLEECKSLQSLVSLYLKQNTQLKNKPEYLNSRGFSKGRVSRSLKLQLKRIQNEIIRLESEMEEIIKTHDQELLTCLKSIPGMGKKTAMFLIISTNRMSGFENAKQLVSSLGLAPSERTSGTSIRGKSRISRAGNPKLRSMMFLCSFTAYKHNGPCKALYDRLVAKGKTPKLALIAVANKLLKQAFAIANSRIPFDPEYRSVKN